MSVLLKSGDLVLGNGDVFIASSVSGLPSVTAYKNALANGTLAGLTGNLGGIKGTVSVQIVREIISLELGVPQEVVDQTCIREGVHFKCALAELSLKTLQEQLGLANANYSTTTAGATQQTDQFTAVFSDDGNPVANPLTKGPVLYTTDTPAAPSNPVVKYPSPGYGSTATNYVDYVIDDVTNTISPVHGGANITNGVGYECIYYYNAFNSETLTGGGNANITTFSVAFFHPYKWGGVFELIIRKANPVGGVTVPFEEATYSHSELEFKAIADFTQPDGANLWSMYRDIPSN